MRGLGWFGVVLLAGLAGAGATTSAVEELARLNAGMHAARVAADWPGYLAGAREMKAFVHGSPDGLLEVARAEAKAGDLQAAIAELAAYGRMGQATDLVETLPDFAGVKGAEGFAPVRAAMAANRRPVSLGSVVFELKDTGLQPEDIDFDARGKRFFITSVRESKLVTADLAGTVTQFASAPDGWPMMAVKVDAERGVVWATEVAVHGFAAVKEADWGRSVLLCFQSKTGKLLRRVEGPRGAALGDLALAGAEVLVSDGDGGGVYRLRAGAAALERVDAGDFVSPQTPVMAADGKHAYVPDYVRGVGLLNLATKQVEWLGMEGRFAMNGIDGLYLDGGRDGGWLIAVENGTSPERVVVFGLDAAGTRVESEKVLERATATLGDPTHGVVVGHDFYYLANSGWDVVDEHGVLKAGAKATAARVMRARIAN